MSGTPYTYRTLMPENFREELERMARAGWTCAQIEAHWGYCENSPVLTSHIRRAFPCQNYTEVKRRLGIKPPPPPPLRETSIEIAAQFHHLFVGHTCLQPVGWVNVKPGTKFERIWSTSQDAKALRAQCPRCLKGEFLPYATPKILAEESAFDEPIGNVPAPPPPLTVTAQAALRREAKRIDKLKSPPKPAPRQPRPMGRPLKEGSLNWKRKQPPRPCKNGCGKMGTLYSKYSSGDCCSRECAQDYLRRVGRAQNPPKPKPPKRRRSYSEWGEKRKLPRELCKNGCGQMSTLYSEWCTGEFCSRQCAREHTSRTTAARRAETWRKKYLLRYEEAQPKAPAGLE